MLQCVDVDPGRFGGVRAGANVAADPAADEIDEGVVVANALVLTIALDQIDDVSDPEDANVQGGFLGDLAARGLGDGLAQLLQSAGQAPLSLPRRLGPAHQENAPALEDDGGHADEGRLGIRSGSSLPDPVRLDPARSRSQPSGFGLEIIERLPFMVLLPNFAVMASKIKDSVAEDGDQSVGRQAGRSRRWASPADSAPIFLAGIVITAPISITFYLAWLFVSFVDSKVTPLIPAAYNPTTYLPFGLPGLGLVIVIVALTLIGAMSAGFVGRMLMRFYERLLSRMPVLRSIYSATKQIIETVVAHQSTAFREAVLVEYPRRGIWCIGFLTGVTRGEVQKLTDEEVLNVFLPTTPNPTSGFLLFVPRRDLIVLDMSVEEALKMVISGGIVAPPVRK